MSRSRSVKAASTWVALAALSFPAVTGAPAESHVGGMWPVGLASIVLVLGGRGARVLPAAGILAIAAASLHHGGHSLFVTLAYASGIVGEALICTGLMRRWLGPRMTVREDLDILRYLGATAAGSAAAAAWFTCTAALAGLDTWWHVALVVFLFHWVSQLLYLGVCVDVGTHAGARSGYERAARWAAAIGVALLAFDAYDVTASLLLLFPVLAWGALRASFRETAWQLITVGVVASTSTYYYGSNTLSGFPGPIGRGEFTSVPVVTFVLVATLTCLPLAVVVGRARARTQEALDAAVEAGQLAARLDFLVSSAPGVGIWELDADGRVRRMNAEAEILLDRTSAHARGRALGELGTPAPAVTRRVRGSAAPSSPQVADLGEPQLWQPHRADGSERVVALSLLAVCDRVGRPTGHVATGMDVTDRVRSQRALAAALAAEQQAVARLMDVNRSKDDFVSAVSHELRTPLTSIMGWLEILVQDAAPRTSIEQDALSRIDANSKRLLHLIESLLTLSGAEPVVDGNVHNLVDLADVIRSSAARFFGPGTDIGAQRRTSVELPESPVLVRGPGDQLARAVVELCDNATKFSPPDGVIELVVHTDRDDAVSIVVSNSGAGLTDDEQAHVFDRFYRGDRSRDEVKPGAGLGLSVAKEIVERHGGTLRVRSDPGELTSFVLTLPRWSRAAGAGAAVAAPVTASMA